MTVFCNRVCRVFIVIVFVLPTSLSLARSACERLFSCNDIAASSLLFLLSSILPIVVPLFIIFLSYVPSQYNEFTRMILLCTFSSCCCCRSAAPAAVRYRIYRTYGSHVSHSQSQQQQNQKNILHTLLFSYIYQELYRGHEQTTT